MCTHSRTSLAESSSGLVIQANLLSPNIQKISLWQCEVTQNYVLEKSQERLTTASNQGKDNQGSSTLPKATTGKKPKHAPAFTLTEIGRCLMIEVSGPSAVPYCQPRCRRLGSFATATGRQSSSEDLVDDPIVFNSPVSAAHHVTVGLYAVSETNLRMSNTAASGHFLVGLLKTIFALVPPSGVRGSGLVSSGSVGSGSG